MNKFYLLVSIRVLFAISTATGWIEDIISYPPNAALSSQSVASMVKETRILK